MFVGIGLRLMSGVASFNPISLFAAGEPGVWYDPSDLTTIFQDNAGTTPVTAPGQTVGLMLDKSQGLVLGSELVTNGNFSSGTTGWTGVNATISVVSGSLRITATSLGVAPYAVTSVATVVGKTYLLNATLVADAMTGNSFLYVGTTSGSGDISNKNLGSTPQTSTLTFVATSTTTYISLSGNSFALVGEYIDWDNISCKLTTGYPAFQPTSTQRPTYGINPIVGTRNLLTYTEQFDNAAWTKGASSISADAIAAPDGTTTADKLVENAFASEHIIRKASIGTGQKTASVYFKAGERTQAAIYFYNVTDGVSVSYFDLSAGTVISGTGTISSVGNGWYRCTQTRTATVNDEVVFAPAVAGTTSYAGNGTSGIYVWGAQLEQSATATAYQKVVSQYEVTQAGVQSAGYLAFDGVDDNMVTPTITPNTNSVQVFAGVRKLGNTTGVIVESSNAGLGNAAGTFGLLSASGYLLGSQGTTTAVTTSSDYLGADTKVMTLVNTISADALVARLNGVALAINTADQGTGNYLAYPLNIGHRNTLNAIPFLGRLYSLITRFGANLTTGQITSTESWVNSKTGAF
jgi:hypothetical protein